MNTQEVLQQCTVDGNVVKLPNIQLDRKEYMDVKKSLELIGGSWKGGKVQGFVFPQDPTELLAQIAGGEKRNLKKEYQFFATPDTLADRLVELADIQRGHETLEPSAGQGAIINAIHRRLAGHTVYCYEAMDINQTFINKITGARLLGSDFFDCDLIFDRIIANPPFSKNQDIDHINHMYDRLRNGGRLVTVSSLHWRSSENKKEQAFRKKLIDLNATVINLPAGEFKESGTNIATCIIIIDKAA